MAPGAVEFLKMAASAPSQAAVSKALTRLFAHGGGSRLQPRRSLGTGRCLATPARPARKTRERVEIPGLDRVTYGARMHYVPGLAKPVSPPWTRDYKDPSHYRSPAEEDMELHKDAPCYIFNQRTSALEGVPQALWLTKSQLVPGLPPKVLALAEGPSSLIPQQDLDERVKDAIKHARFWDTTEDRPSKGQYSSTLLSNLLHLCASLSSSPSARSSRVLAEKSSVAASWRRGEDLFQVRGQMGLLSRSMEPLQKVADAQEVAQTTNHVLETFYPVSPAIQLQKVHVYKDKVNSTGFHEDHAYPYTHTLYFLDGVDSHCKLRPEQLRAKMIMFTFGNALAHARAMYGEQGVLERPVTLQAVATNGRVFHFLVFQLNTTDLTGDDGIKNQVWLDGDVELYDFAKVRPLIKRKQVKVPAGLAGYKPETFNKFLSLYLHGAA